MQAKRTVCAGIAPVALLVSWVLLGPAFARADTITTFNVSATTIPPGPLAGTFQVDVTTGTVIRSSVDITYPGVSAFNQLLESDPLKTSDWTINVGNSRGIGDALTLDFTTTKTPGSLVGFTGGTITGGVAFDTSGEKLFSIPQAARSLRFSSSWFPNRLRWPCWLRVF